MHRRTLSVMAGDKVGHNCHEVFLELSLVASAVAESHILVENHDAAPTRSEHGLHEFVGDSAEPVPVGDHDLFDISADRALQKGDKATPVEVDPRRNILNDFVTGVLVSEQFALPREVFFLRGPSAVNDFGSLPRLCCCFSCSNWDLQDTLDVREAVEPLPTGADSDNSHFLAVCEPAQRVV